MPTFTFSSEDDILYNSSPSELSISAATPGLGLLPDYPDYNYYKVTGSLTDFAYFDTSSYESIDAPLKNNMSYSNFVMSLGSTSDSSQYAFEFTNPKIHYVL